MSTRMLNAGVALLVLLRPLLISPIQYTLSVIQTSQFTPFYAPFHPTQFIRCRCSSIRTMSSHAIVRSFSIFELAFFLFFFFNNLNYYFYWSSCSCIASFDLPPPPLTSLKCNSLISSHFCSRLLQRVLLLGDPKLRKDLAAAYLKLGKILAPSPPCTHPPSPTNSPRRT